MKYFALIVAALATISVVVAQGQVANNGIAEGAIAEDQGSLNIDDDTSEMDSRIILGRKAREGQFPWQAIIRYRAGWLGPRMICGGSIISPRHILTAAHCLYKTTITDVILGTTEPYEAENPNRVVPVVSRSLYNKDYNDANLANDVGILELKYPLNFTDYIRAIALPKSTDFVDANENVTISGWGQISDTDKVAVGNLNFIELRTLANDECRRTYGSYIRDYNLCTRGDRGQNVCSGDSGGPLVKYDANNVATQVGIVSFVAGRGCELPIPAGFMRTASVLPWVSRATGIPFA